MKKNSFKTWILLLSVLVLFFINCDKENVNPPEPNFVISAGFIDTDASIRYSETGINWPADYVTSISQADLINGLAYGNDKFIGVGNGLYAYHSNDGIEWGQSNLDSIVSYNDVAFGEYNNQSPWLPYFVAVGSNGAVMHTSSNGKIWTADSSGIIKDLHGIAFGLTTSGLSMFVAVGDAPYMPPAGADQYGTIIYSITAGESWIKHSIGGTTRDLNCVAFGGGRFITAGESADMHYSENGSVWQSVNSNSVKHIYGICHGTADNTLIWVAVGSEGAVLYSQDNGDNWVEQVYDSNKTWKAVINVNDKFYAVGYGRDDGLMNGVEGEIIISNNGIDWYTAATFPDYENYFRDIVAKN